MKNQEIRSFQFIESLDNGSEEYMHWKVGLHQKISPTAVYSKSPIPTPPSTKSIWQGYAGSEPAMNLLMALMGRAVGALLRGLYADLDAHTTSNCCHGMAVLVGEVIRYARSFDLREIMRWLDSHEGGTFPEEMPDVVFDLASLYALTWSSEVVHEKGRRTAKNKLKLVSPVGTRFCYDIVPKLQKHFSNQVVNSYLYYFSQVDLTQKISGVSIALWGKYVGREHVRVDKQGIGYTSCLFSMQVLLGYLMQRRAKIAIINELNSEERALKGRYIQVFEGDGTAHFRMLSDEELFTANLHDSYEPVVVFLGRSISNTLEPRMLEGLMEPWAKEISELILACDTFYPQFPGVSYDSDFSSAPIVPEESLLREVIEEHGRTKGVSKEDPSLFCLMHVYPASISQVVHLRMGREESMHLHDWSLW